MADSVEPVPWDSSIWKVIYWKAERRHDGRVGAARDALPGLERSEESWSTQSRSGARHIIGGAMEAGNGTERQRLDHCLLAAIYAMQ